MVKSNGFNIRQDCVGAGCSTRWGCQLAEVLPCTAQAEALLPVFYKMGSEISVWAFSHCHRACVSCVPLSTLNACTHTGFIPGSSLHTNTHVCMLQMLKETLPVRTAANADLHCKEQFTRVKSNSWEANIPCGAEGQETGSKDDEQLSKTGWRRAETLWDMQQASTLACSKRVSSHLDAGSPAKSVTHLLVPTGVT